MVEAHPYGMKEASHIADYVWLALPQRSRLQQSTEQRHSEGLYCHQGTEEVPVLRSSMMAAYYPLPPSK
jgi:hypothetical protein